MLIRNETLADLVVSKVADLLNFFQFVLNLSITAIRVQQD